MHWEEKYSKNFKEFFAKIISWNPDYIVPVARKACKLLKANQSVLNEVSEKVFFKEYFELFDINFKNGNEKKVAVFDDTVNTGNELQEYKEFFEKRKADVKLFAFVGRQSTIDPVLSKDDKLSIPIKKSDIGYAEYIKEQIDFIISQGGHLDIDHIVLEIELDNIETLEKIFFSLHSIGHLYIVPSDENQCRFTIDRPALFTEEDLKNINRYLRLDEILKVRFFKKHSDNRLIICPMVFPKVLDESSFESSITSLIPDLKLWKILIDGGIVNCDRDFKYMVLSLTLGALLGKRLISFLISKDCLNSKLAKIRVNSSNFYSFFGRECGKKFAEEINRFITDQKESEITDFSSLSIPYPTIAKETIQNLEKNQSKQKDYTDYLWEGYQKKLREVGKRKGIHFMLNFQQLYSISKITPSQLSELLDYDCDYGIVVPVIEGGKRLYRTGEKKQFCIEWERTKVLVPMIIETLAKDKDLDFGLSKEILPENTAPLYFLTKFISCFAVDFPIKEFPLLHCIQVEGGPYGSRPVVCNRHTNWKKTHLHHAKALGDGYGVIRLPKKHGFRVVAKAKLGWHTAWKRYFKDEPNLPVSESTIHLYFRFLRDVYKKYSKRFERGADILKWLAMGRNFEYYYGFIYDNLYEWRKYFEGFLILFKDFQYSENSDCSSYKNNPLGFSANYAKQAKRKLKEYETGKICEFFDILIREFGDMPEYSNFVERIKLQYQKYPEYNRLKFERLELSIHVQHALSVLVQSTIENIKINGKLNLSFKDQNKETTESRFNEFISTFSKLPYGTTISLEEYIELTTSFPKYKSILSDWTSKIRRYFGEHYEPLREDALVLATSFSYAFNKAIDLAIQNEIWSPIYVFIDFTGYKLLTGSRQKLSLIENYTRKWVGILTELFEKHNGIKFWDNGLGDSFGYIFKEPLSFFTAVALTYQHLENENQTIKDIPPYLLKIGADIAKLIPPDMAGNSMQKVSLAWEFSQWDKKSYPNECLITDNFYETSCKKGMEPEFFDSVEDLLLDEEDPTTQEVFIHCGYRFLWKVFLK